MQIFLDTANVNDVDTWQEWVDGVTTNPSLIARQNQPFHDVIRTLCRLVQGPVSAEVTHTSNVHNMYKEARTLADISEHVVVKVPLTPMGLKVGSMLSKEGVRVNATLCFSLTQALLAAKAGATYVSPFIGRLDDHGGSGVQLVHDICSMYKTQGFTTHVLAASIRHVEHVVMAAQAGTHAITLPPHLMTTLFEHPLTHQGIDKFEHDWQIYKESSVSCFESS